MQKLHSRTPDAGEGPDILDPAETESGGIAEFAEAARSLGLTSDEARPRRWISRIGALLRQTRARQNIGQEAIAKLAQVTQPYLSRLENGLLPKRGPTIDVLLRCAEAAQCDLEISMRSKKDGSLIGRVSSADLGRSASDMRDRVQVDWSSESGAGRENTEMVNVEFERSTGTAQPGVVWVVARDDDGRVAFDTLRGEAEGVIARTFKRLRALQEKSAPSATNETPTVHVAEGDVVVLGSSPGHLATTLATYAKKTSA